MGHEFGFLVDDSTNEGKKRKALPMVIILVLRDFTLVSGI
jgi:hypothetical protein